MNLPAKPKGLQPAQPTKMAELLNYQEGTIVSRELLKKPSGNVTLFAIDEGEGLSEHTSPYDALVQLLEGKAEITVDGEVHTVGEGEIMLLPAGQPHALKAIESFKMMLTMIRS